MLEMAFGAFFFHTNILNVPLKEDVKPLIAILFICWLSFLDMSLKFGKEFLDGVKIWRIRWQIQYFNTCI